MQDRSKVQVPTNKQSSIIEKFFPAAMAGILTHVLMHPYDTVIRRTQIYPHSIKTMNDFNRALFENSGAKTFTQQYNSLWKGFISSGVYHLVTRTIKFGIQTDASHWLSGVTGNMTEACFGKKLGDAVTHASAAALVDLFVTLVTFPLDTIKIKRQNHNTIPLTQLVTQENLKLYNGLSMMMARNLPGSAALFGVSYAILTAGFGLEDTKNASFKQRMLASLGGGVAAAIVTNPQDLLKTQLQTNTCLSTLSLFKQALREEGLWALLTKGLGLRMFQVAPKLALPLILTGYFEQLWTQHQAPLPVEREVPRGPLTRRSL